MYSYMDSLAGYMDSKCEVFIFAQAYIKKLSEILLLQCAGMNTWIKDMFHKWC